MRIALLSDIHANLDSLKEVLAQLDRQRVDHILCAGDLVERGDSGDAVVELVRERDIPTVQGNHDFEASANQRWLRTYGDPNHPNMKRHLLRDETIAYVQALPISLRFTFEDQTLLLSHANPWNHYDYVFPQSAPSLFERVAVEAEADVVVLGHTHVPMCVRVDHRNTWVLNPGSVGDPRLDNSMTYAILTLPDMSFDVYDVLTGQTVPVEPLMR